MMTPASQWYLGGTVRHCFDRVTIAPASNTPKPKRWLNSRPTPFIVQWKRFLASKRELRFDVSTVKCWISLQVSIGLKICETFSSELIRKELIESYFASRARAKTPAASGAAALVPECVVVHFPYKSVVALNARKKVSQKLPKYSSVCAYHSGVWILGAITECAGQCGTAAFIVMCILSIIDGTVDRDCPHGRSISITIAVILFTAITRCPDVNVPQTIAALVDSLHNCPHGCITWPINGLAIIGRSPWSAVNVDLVWLMSHRIRLNQVGHVGLIQHPYPSNLRVVCDAHTADAIVTCGSHFSGTAGAMTESEGKWIEYESLCQF